METKNFDYDELTDSLFISRKKSDEKVQGSAEIGNLILDFTSQGRIVNIEFQGISKFLNRMNINPEFIHELTDVNLIVEQQRGAVSIFALLKTPNVQQPIPLATLPMQNLSFM